MNGTAQSEQQQVLQAAVFDGTLRAPLEKHERAERHRFLAVLPQQVDIDREADGGRSGEKPWREEAQLPSPLPDGQIVRSAWSSGFDVSMKTYSSPEAAALSASSPYGV